MKILCFGASSSKKSIYKQLAVYASTFFTEAEIEVLDLNDYAMPIFSVVLEEESGIPDKAHKFKEQLEACDGVIISFAEHNGAYATAFKNIMDWKSRIPESKIWENTPMFVLSTSPGKRGGSNVMTIVMSHFPHQGAEIISSFSLPSFYQNYSPEEGIVDVELKSGFLVQVEAFRRALISKI